MVVIPSTQSPVILSSSRRLPPTLTVDATEIARKVTGRAELSDVSCELRLLHGTSDEPAGGVYRLRGEGHDGKRRLFWHVIVKVRTAAGGSDDPRRSDYWRRESGAFASGALESLPPGLRAPACFAVVERDESAHIYMADVHDTSDSAWGAGDFATAARSLGQFNGAYLGGVALPTGDWVSQGWLRAYCAELSGEFDRLDGLARHPLFPALYPRDTAERLGELWRTRERLLGGLDQLAPTFAHLNAARGNLARLTGPSGVPELVAVDWACTGVAPVGQELGALVIGSCLGFDLELTDLRLVEELAIASYASALRGGGWYGDERTIRFGYAASAALRYSACTVERLNAMLDGSRGAGAERGVAQAIDGSTARCIAVRDYALRLGDQASALIPAL